MKNRDFDTLCHDNNDFVFTQEGQLDSINNMNNYHKNTLTLRTASTTKQTQPQNQEEVSDEESGSLSSEELEEFECLEEILIAPTAVKRTAVFSILTPVITDRCNKNISETSLQLPIMQLDQQLLHDLRARLLHEMKQKFGQTLCLSPIASFDFLCTEDDCNNVELYADVEHYRYAYRDTHAVIIDNDDAFPYFACDSDEDNDIDELNNEVAYLSSPKKEEEYEREVDFILSTFRKISLPKRRSAHILAVQEQDNDEEMKARKSIDTSSTASTTNSCSSSENELQHIAVAADILATTTDSAEHQAERISNHKIVIDDIKNNNITPQKLKDTEKVEKISKKPKQNKKKFSVIGFAVCFLNKIEENRQQKVLKKKQLVQEQIEAKKASLGYQEVLKKGSPLGVDNYNSNLLLCKNMPSLPTILTLPHHQPEEKNIFEFEYFLDEEDDDEVLHSLFGT